MSMPMWFYNLSVYCIQLAILIAAGALMVAVTRLREPRLRLIYWQVLLAIGVLLPAVEPWQTAPKIEQGMADAGAGAAHAGSAGIEAAAALRAHVAPSFSIYQIVAMVLVAGLLFRLLWLAAGLVRLRRSRLRAQPLGPHAAVEQFKAALSVSPAVLVSDRISSPVTFGWRTPQILLPWKFAEMEDARQRAILCHEFLHVQRRDWLWHVGEEFLRSLFWFHLAVEWLIGQIRLCREQLVDREVVTLAGSRRDYLDALFEIASSSRSSRYAPALLFLSERHLKRRVTLILKEVTMSRKKLALALSASLCGLLLTGAVAVTLLPLRTSAAQDSSAVSPKARTVRPDTHFYGNPHARVTVVEFGDFQCPACREAASVAEQVRKNMGNQVRFAYRQFPLTRIHHQSEKAAEAAECAAEQGKFWQAVHYLSDHQLDFSSAGVRQFAASIGLDEARTMQCLSSGAMAARVQQDVGDGQTLGVHSVPTFFVGNAKIIGTPTYSQLHNLIELQLRAEGNGQDTPPDGSTVLSAASLAPLFAEGLNGQEAGTASQGAVVAADPPAQGNQSSSNDIDKNHRTYVNQAEIQQKVDEALKRAKIAQQAASKIDQKKIQEQVDRAMMQLKMAKIAAPQIDQAKINLQIKEQMKQLQKLNTPEMREQMKKQMEQLAKLNSPEMRQRMQEQMKQLQKLNTPEMREQMKKQMEQLQKMNNPEIRRKIEEAMKQAQVANSEAQKLNSAEVRRQLKQTQDELQAARKQLEQAREQLKTERLESRKNREEAKPLPPRPPKPPSPSAKPAPPAPPAPPPPKTPESAAVAGGVPGGVVGGVPGGKIGGVQGGQVIGVPGGITGGVVTAPQPPKPAPVSPIEAVPPTPPAPPSTPAPPTPPQN